MKTTRAREKRVNNSILNADALVATHTDAVARATDTGWVRDGIHDARRRRRRRMRDAFDDDAPNDGEWIIHWRRVGVDDDDVPTETDAR